MVTPHRTRVSMFRAFASTLVDGAPTSEDTKPSHTHKFHVATITVVATALTIIAHSFAGASSERTRSIHLFLCPERQIERAVGLSASRMLGWWQQVEFN